MIGSLRLRLRLRLRLPLRLRLQHTRSWGAVVRVVLAHAGRRVLAQRAHEHVVHGSRLRHVHLRHNEQGRRCRLMLPLLLLVVAVLGIVVGGIVTGGHHDVCVGGHHQARMKAVGELYVVGRVGVLREGEHVSARRRRSL